LTDQKYCAHHDERAALQAIAHGYTPSDRSTFLDVEVAQTDRSVVRLARLIRRWGHCLSTA
jgi:hypothetical protein